MNLSMNLSNTTSPSETEDATSQSLLSGYDTLSRFTLNVQVTKAKASAREVTIVPDPAHIARNTIQTGGFPESMAKTGSVATDLSLIV